MKELERKGEEFPDGPIEYDGAAEAAPDDGGPDGDGPATTPTETPAAATTPPPTTPAPKVD